MFIGRFSIFDKCFSRDLCRRVLNIRTRLHAFNDTRYVCNSRRVSKE